MAFASGSGVRVAAVAETTFGVTPATPSFDTLRVTSGGLRTQKATGTSNERQPDRNVRDEYELGQDVVGSYDFELSYGSFDAILAAVLGSDWATNVLKNGLTPKYFTFEETYELGATDTFRRFDGCRVNTFSLNIGARAAITGSMSIMGRAETLAEAILTGATYADPLDTPVSTASANVASLTVSGVDPAPKVRSLSMEINNGVRTRPVVGSKFSEEFGEGRFNLTGNLEAYFQNKALYERVLSHGNGAVSFVVGNAANEKYRITIPNMKFGDGNITAGGNDDDVMAVIPYRGLLDATEDCTLKIERAVA
jgi:hypothetical protein